MKILTTFFSQLLEMSITASIVIIAVLIVRCLLQRLPKKYSYCLWAVVLFRLLCPVSISSVFSIFNLGGYEWKRFLGLTDVTEAENVVMLPSEEITVTELAGETAGAVTMHEYTPGVYEYAAVDSAVPMWLQMAAVLWLIGIVAILFYSIYTYGKFRKTVEKATFLQENIYECENIPSPFVMGVFSPKIYIPYHLNEEEQAYVLTHEKYHIKRCDHIVKIVAFLVLSLYWFNPFVWLAYFFACRDMEMSCDEKVLSMLGNEIKQDYSVLLLSFATNRRLSFAGPLAFGESDTGKRVKNVLRFQKPKVWGSILGIGLLALVVLGCATNEKEEDVVEATGTDTNAGTEKINVYDELENVQIEGIPVEKADAVRHNYGEKVESAEPEELSFIQDWAVAFCNRDGKTIYEMAAEESRSMLADTLLLEEHDNGAYSFGWSSPWPMNANADWRIISIGNGKAVILYYAWTSDPHVTVWRSEVSYEKVDGKYQCIPEEIQMLDGIDSVEDFYQAYPYAVLRDTQMDYLTNGMGEVLNKNAKASRDTMPEYEELFSPDTAVKNLLNLSDNVNAYARAYVEKDREDGTAYARAYVGEDGEDASYVRLLFPDGYMMMIQMVRPYGEDGIWIPQAYLTEDEMEAILQEEVIDLQEEATEKLLPNQSSTASNKVYSIYNFFDDPHEGGLETSIVDLNGDGALEEISVERLANVGGDGGYIVHVKNADAGKEIQLPKEIAGEQYPFSTVWNENGLQVMYNDTCIANYPTDFIYETYEKKAVILAEDALDTEQLISGDAASGYTVYKNEDELQLILKYYLSGLEGHADCFGYGLVHLQLQSDNTWNVETSFAVDLAYEE